MANPNNELSTLSKWRLEDLRAERDLQDALISLYFTRAKQLAKQREEIQKKLDIAHKKLRTLQEKIQEYQTKTNMLPEERNNRKEKPHRDFVTKPVFGPIKMLREGEDPDRRRKRGY